MLHWTSWASFGLGVFFMGSALALFVYRSRPDRAQNRRLALQLATEAIVVGIIGGAVWIFTDFGLVRVLTIAAYMLVWMKLWTYYSFLATLDTPLARPLQRRGALTGFLAVTILLALTVLWRTDIYIGQTEHWAAVDGVMAPPGSFFKPMFWMWSAMWLVGLSFSISAWRNAPTQIRRNQARYYLLAFGFRDISFTVMTAVFTFVSPSYRYFHVIFVLFPTIWLVYFPLVTYGILKYQLFDITLKLRRGLERSAIAAVIAMVFFVGSYATEQYLQVNNFMVGLAAAALITLAFQPLQRGCERLVGGMMPGVGSGDEYLLERKHEVYRDAVEGALLDGTVSEKERDILGRLQASLGISNGEADDIERMVRESLLAHLKSNLVDDAPLLSGV